MALAIFLVAVITSMTSVSTRSRLMRLACGVFITTLVSSSPTFVSAEISALPQSCFRFAVILNSSRSPSPPPFVIVIRITMVSFVSPMRILISRDW